MKRLLIVMLLLILPSLGWGQAVIVGEFPIPEKIKEAKYTLAAAEPKVLVLNVGEFEIIEPAKTLAGTPLYWHVSDSSIMQRIEVAANQGYGLWMKRRGEPEAKLHLFPARPVAWVILVGAKQGASSIAIIRNGLVLANDPPTVVDSVAVTVGTPKPVIPPPVKPDNPVVPPDQLLITELKQLLAKDKAENNGDWKYAKEWAETFKESSSLLLATDPAMIPRSVGDLYTAHKAMWQANGVPVLPFLSNTRLHIATMLEKKFGKNVAVPFDPKEASKLYGMIGDALMEALK